MIEFIDRILKNPRLIKLKNIATGEVTKYDIQDYEDDEVIQNGTEINALILNKAFLDMHPVGCIYLTSDITNPGILFGGTWEQIAQGRTLVGVDDSQTEFNTVKKTGGEKTHILKIDEMPPHNHLLCGSPADSADWIDGVQRVKYDVNKKTASNTYTLDQLVWNTGGSQAHNNLQPYEVDNWIIKASKTTSTPTKSEVTNTYSKSENSVYSCNYINEKLDALYKMIQ